MTTNTNNEIIKEHLNKAIKEHGFELIEDDHILEIWHDGNLVDKFNAATVKCQAIYNSMRLYLIKIGKLDESELCI